MERTKFLTRVMAIAVFLGVTPFSFAQRGMGDMAGIARQGIKPTIVTFQGQVVKVVTGPCEKTTGWSLFGTHFFLKDKEGTELNIHLGPSQLVKKVADFLPVSTKVTAQVFRTDKMPKDNYIAVMITAGDKKMLLRDKDLRPLWAGGIGRGQAQINLTKPGRNVNIGVCCPRQFCPQIPDVCPKPCCRGCYKSASRGRGRGYGRGDGRVRGYGRGNGYGRGYGRGVYSSRW